MSQMSTFRRIDIRRNIALYEVSDYIQTNIDLMTGETEYIQIKVLYVTLRKARN